MLSFEKFVDLLGSLGVCEVAVCSFEGDDETTRKRNRALTDWLACWPLVCAEIMATSPALSFTCAVGTPPTSTTRNIVLLSHLQVECPPQLQVTQCRVSHGCFVAACEPATRETTSPSVAKFSPSAPGSVKYTVCSDGMSCDVGLSLSVRWTRA